MSEQKQVHHLYRHLELNHARQVLNGEPERALATFDKMALLSLHLEEKWLPEVQAEHLK